MYAAIAPWLDVDLGGLARFEALLLPVIDQVLANIPGAREKPFRLALSLGLPASRPGLSPNLQPTLLQAVSVRYPGRFAAMAGFSNGHVAGLMAFEAAAKALQRGQFDACVVAGVDSYIEPETLEWLEASEQLHRAGSRKNAWGFIPGEGAGAALLVGHKMAACQHLAAIGSLLRSGMALEPNRIKTETVCIGEGLTIALRGALRGLPPGSKVTDLYCDMNGEPYRADEYGFATLRVADMYDPNLTCQTPADCLGDVGAASGLVLTSLALLGALKGYSNGSIALVFCGAEAGERSAALLSTASPEG
jgi:3-oxoacyl-[acyl-carrier-protein] synthase-1